MSSHRSNTAWQNNRRSALLCVGLVFFALCAAFLTRGGTASPSEFGFPISEGTYWVYQGVVRWGHVGYADEREREVLWKMQTGQVIHHGDLTAAVLKGFPSDLNWTTGDVEPRETLLVRTKEDQYYFVGPMHFRSAWIRLQGDMEPLKGLMTETDLLFQMPLTQGARFCGADVIERTESSALFCWHVGATISESIQGIKGVPAAKKPVTEIHFLTKVDETEIEIIPGIGITRYEYHRQSPPADTVLKLLEFHVGTGLAR